MVELSVGEQYKNRANDVLTIIVSLKKDDPLYRLGLRFMDSVGRCYRADGIANSDGTESRFDLVEEFSHAVSDRSLPVEVTSEEVEQIMDEFFLSPAYDPNAVVRKTTVRAAIQFTLDKMKKAAGVRV